MKRKLLWVVLWIAAALFPFGYVTLFSRTYARVFDYVFGIEATHIIMHAFIFRGLMLLLVITFGDPGSLTPHQVLIFFLAVGAVAVAQELIQLGYKQHPWSAAETFDVATDLTGALMGLVVWRSPGRLITGSRDRRNLVV